MAFTTDDLERIERAIARGEDTVQFADRTVKYRSIEDLLLARDTIKGSLRTRSKQTLVVGQKGFGPGSCA